MPEELLHKTNTGIASEFLVAGELARRAYNVTLTLGNTKAIDLLVEKQGRLIPIQVKGIQRKRSICWNLSPRPCLSSKPCREAGHGRFM